MLSNVRLGSKNKVASFPGIHYAEKNIIASGSGEVKRAEGSE
jgi:hypothetical protein